MKESELERIFVNEVRKEGGEAYKWVSPGNDGVPDRIVIFPSGDTYFVELKAEGGQVRPVQQRQIERLWRLNQKAVVVVGREGMINFFDTVCHKDAAARLRARFEGR